MWECEGDVKCFVPLSWDLERFLSTKHLERFLSTKHGIQRTPAATAAPRGYRDRSLRPPTATGSAPTAPAPPRRGVAAASSGAVPAAPQPRRAPPASASGGSEARAPPRASAGSARRSAPAGRSSRAARGDAPGAPPGGKARRKGVPPCPASALPAG